MGRKFQSTLPVGGATTTQAQPWQRPEISIHAPRGGSDPRVPDGFIRPSDFNPRSPWGERQAAWLSLPVPEYFNPRSPWGERQQRFVDEYLIDLFQSTLPVGGATLTRDVVWRIWRISIHAPRGGSDQVNPTADCGAIYFNPRSPWGERLCAVAGVPDPEPFQSTLPVGGATSCNVGGPFP